MYDKCNYKNRKMIYRTPEDLKKRLVVHLPVKFKAPRFVDLLQADRGGGRWGVGGPRALAKPRAPRIVDPPQVVTVAHDRA